MNESHIKAMLEGLSAELQRQRAATQMTLGDLISELEAMPKDAVVANLCEPHSYRGYYSDLAFKLQDGTRLASDLLSDCRAAMGMVFYGYKGGDFVMGSLTPIWVAEYGCCGRRLMALGVDGEIEAEYEDDD
jgi:hypothetical protein